MTHTLFVYGTLKRGLRYHAYLENAEFVAQARTVEAFPLVYKPRGIPYLIDVAGVGHRVWGEVYRVNDETLRQVDELESHPRWYRRKETPVELENGDIITAWVYFCRAAKWRFSDWRTNHQPSYGPFSPAGRPMQVTR